MSKPALPSQVCKNFNLVPVDKVNKDLNNFTKLFKTICVSGNVGPWKALYMPVKEFFSVQFACDC